MVFCLSYSSHNSHSIKKEVLEGILMAEHKDSDYVLAFDTLYTNNHIQMLKVILPRLPRERRNQLALYIKYKEFQYTLSYVEKTKHQINICTSDPEPMDFASLMKELQYYCTDAEQKKFKEIADMMQALEMFQEMQKYKDLFSATVNPTDATNENESTSNMDVTSLLKNLLSPEQQAMFEMFRNQE